MLVEDDVPRGQDAPGDRIEAPIPAVIRGIAEEDARNRAGVKLVASSGGGVGVAEAAKHAQQAVIRSFAKQKFIWGSIHSE